MRNLGWIWLWEGLPTILALPVDPSYVQDPWALQWENHWPRYVVGMLSFVVVAFTLAGCLCCRRQQRPKGFQEFKDGSTAGTETTIERAGSTSLELEGPRILASSRDKINFDGISCSDARPTIKPPSSSFYNENETHSMLEKPYNDVWRELDNFPREKLKYLREIGRGWFGKVVEGTTLFEDNETTKFGKNRGVVVRILTEDAMPNEKSWFLGESTPYLKLAHPNIVKLLGFCLETEPYLLIFESCPVGDLKHFLLTNRQNAVALGKENVPTRMALNIANALEHMHDNGFSHTDLSARNCLIGQDLTAKIGDYGTGVEKYPLDYYVVGDRALPIRWSAPESLCCTETTIETRAITPLANIWSFGILLWEIGNWGERPYDELSDEQIIQLIFSRKTEEKAGAEDSTKLLAAMTKNHLPTNFSDAVGSAWKYSPKERPSLAELREILCGKRIQDFDERWRYLKPNIATIDKSASLRDLRDDGNAEIWQENYSSAAKHSPRANFRLGPVEQPIVESSTSILIDGSGSETEEESWRGRVERGAYTEKVKQKSKSVADLMVLVHIESDSELESSLGPCQNTEKISKKRLATSGSAGDLRSALVADEFNEALRKLRDTNAARPTNYSKSGLERSSENRQTPEKSFQEEPKVLTLTSQGETPILRLSFGVSPSIAAGNDRDQEIPKPTKITETPSFSNDNSTEKHVLRLIPKGDPEPLLLRYLPTSTPNKSSTKSTFADSFNDENKVEHWSGSLSQEIEKETPIFHRSIDPIEFPVDFKEQSASTKSLERLVAGSSSFLGQNCRISQSEPATPYKKNHSASSTIENSAISEDIGAMNNFDGVERPFSVNGRLPENVESAPDTPQSRGNYSVGNVDEDSSCEELEPGIIKRSLHDDDDDDDEEDRKHLSTPDDERSSDSGFRDKESCEEEESPIPQPIMEEINNSESLANSQLSPSAEEEQMRILFELDTILDAEYYRNYENQTDEEREAKNHEEEQEKENARSFSESHDSTGSTEIFKTFRSCEANFLDNFLDANEESRYDNVNNLENTEMDSLSELCKIEEDSRGQSKKEFDVLTADSSSESPIKTDKNLSNDSSSELILSNLDSSSLRDKHLTSNDLSPETPSDFTKNPSSNSEFSPYNCPSNREGQDGLEIQLDREKSTSSSPSSVGNEALDEGNVPTTLFHEAIETSNAAIIENSAKKTEATSLEENDLKSPGRSVKEIEKMETSSCSSAEKILQGNTESELTNLGTERKEIARSKETDSKEPGTSLVETERREMSSDSLLEKTIDKITEPEATLKNLETERKEIGRLKEPGGSLIDIEPVETSSFSPIENFLENTAFQETLQNLETERKEIVRSEEIDTKEQDKLAEETERMETALYSDKDEERGNTVENSTIKGSEYGWSSRENLNENDDEDSSTMSMRSDNSYVSFGLDEEFVAAIRNELREKLPHAQMPVVEALDPHDDKEESSRSINTEISQQGNRWSDEDLEEEEAEIGEENAVERSNSVDIAIRYNIYGTPLSPIMEERESNSGTSESLMSKEDSGGDASITSGLSEEVLVIDTRTNRAMIVERTGNPIADNPQILDDRDPSSHADFSDEENLECPGDDSIGRCETTRIDSMRTGCAPLPSPEEESKWQQHISLPLQMQDDLMSTSFGTDRDWDSQDEDEEEEEEEDDEDGKDEDEDAEEEENSSSSGEFVWKRYDESHGDAENVTAESPLSKPRSQESEIDLNEEKTDCEDEEEEFTPSAWDASLAPHRSALRSPEKNVKTGDQKKSVWFKKQRYHCVYEYPKETPVVEGQVATTWEPTLYSDWEEMMDEPRLDIYPMEYEDLNRTGDEEFYVSSSNRPFESGEGGKYVSQFFPGANTTLLQQHEIPSSAGAALGEAEQQATTSQDEFDGPEIDSQQSFQTNGVFRGLESAENLQQTQLGELRHTRDRLKLNLLSTGGPMKSLGSEDPIDQEIGDEKSSEKTPEILAIDKIEQNDRATVNLDDADATKKSENTDERKRKTLDVVEGKLDISTMNENPSKRMKKIDDKDEKIVKSASTLGTELSPADKSKIDAEEQDVCVLTKEIGESSNVRIRDEFSLEGDKAEATGGENMELDSAKALEKLINTEVDENPSNTLEKLVEKTTNIVKSVSTDDVQLSLIESPKEVSQEDNAWPIEKIGESSSAEVFDNLAVKEASKNNEAIVADINGESGKKQAGADAEKGQSKTFNEDSIERRVGGSANEESSITIGDQQRESSNTRVEVPESESLFVRKLETDESPSNISSIDTGVKIINTHSSSQL